MDVLFEVPVRPVDELLTTEHSIPDEIPGTATTLLWVFLAFVVKVQADLRIDTNAEVIVHDTFLFEVTTESKNKIDCPICKGLG